MKCEYRILSSDSYWKGLRDGCDFRKFRIEKRSFILWHSVDSTGEPHHYEHFSHGNDYFFYESIADAEKAIAGWEHHKIRMKTRRDPDIIVATSSWGSNA